MNRCCALKPLARIVALFLASGFAACIVVLGGCAAPEGNSAETLNATFEANAGTGYEWTCSVEDDTIVEVVNSDITSEGEDGAEPISGGPQTYTFTLKAPEDGNDGKTTVTFNFARSWEQTVDDISATWEVESKDGLLTINSYDGPDEYKDVLTTPEDW